MRVEQTINPDGTRWTGPFDSQYKASVYVFGDSFTYGEGVHDEHTFSALLQRSRPDLRVRLFALPGWGTVQAYVNFNRIKSEIRPEDIIVIGYADFFDVRNVVAPSRLREVDEYFRKLGRPSEEILLPKAALSADGKIEISLVQQACSINKSYCQQSDPSKSDMTKISAELTNYIARNTEAQTILLHFDGDPNNPIFGMLDKRVKHVSALPRDFDYFMRDNIAGFDPHPGPYWHYAISRRLLDVVAEKQE